MIELWYSIIGLLPFTWVSYEFMKNALLAVIIVTPCFGLVGTMVVGNRMAFFSDVIGHSALTGIAIGVILGFTDVRPVMIIFAVILSVSINIILEKTKASSDTVIGVFSASTVALGVALLSRGGSFNKYSVFLIGDILSVTRMEIFYLVLLLAGVVLFWIFFGSYLALISVEPSLAYDRAISPFVVKTLFSILVALVVILSIRWVGLLIINSLFILPAASARLVSGSLKDYYFRSMYISMLSGISGLIISFYTGSACGATIVLCSAAVYISILVVKGLRRSAGW
ncbi:MAG TPA: metal ABC transporter permease [Spirochaetota bacterium]|nr:metal ABC transporter permease [Spirochaetota bacterium]HPS85680.1 metal ABC transporter permease [Spirochaetota bacterium]